MNKGYGLIEIIVGAALMSVVLFALLGVTHNAVRLSRESLREVQASLLLEEGAEAVRLLRDRSWINEIASLAPGTEYFLEFDSATWQSTTTEEIIDGLFQRSFNVENVNRDINDDIVSSGTFDPDTRKVNLLVSWPNLRGTTTRQEVSTYLTNFFSE